MSISNSEYLEELLHECYKMNIIDEVRKEAVSIMEKDNNVSMFDAYDIAFKKISKKN